MTAHSSHRPQYSIPGIALSILGLLFLTFLRPAPGQAQQKPTTFTARLVNIESVSTTPFRFNVSLHNGKTTAQIFQLKADVPIGWISTFTTEGSQVSAVRVDSGKTQEITIELNAAPTTKPGKYTVPVSAINGNDSLKVELEAVVKGKYQLELSTPTGLLSGNVTEGRSKQIQLVVKNTGSLPLKDIDLSAQTPSQWSASFEPSKIDQIDAGQSKDVVATLNVPDKTIAGDYMTTFTAKDNNTTSNAAFRMTVKTSLLSGWIGIIVILIALGIVYYLIRKYGRR